MEVIYDHCGVCEEICGSPRCFNCQYFSDSHLMYEPDDEDDDEVYGEDHGEVGYWWDADIDWNEIDEDEEEEDE